jgi:hypothetical protein
MVAIGNMFVVFGGFLKLFVQNKNFNLTLQTKSPMRILEILKFNISSVISFVKPNIKDHKHNRRDSIFFILSAKDRFFRHDGFLFKENKLCVPNCSLRELLVREAHGCNLMGHFGIAKTLDVLHEYFYWPNMKRDVQRICDRCITCRQAKSRVMPHGLYTSLPVPKEPWVDVSMDFILGLPRSRKGRDYICCSG